MCQLIADCCYGCCCDTVLEHVQYAVVSSDALTTRMTTRMSNAVGRHWQAQHVVRIRYPWPTGVSICCVYSETIFSLGSQSSATSWPIPSVPNSTSIVSCRMCSRAERPGCVRTPCVSFSYADDQKSRQTTVRVSHCSMWTKSHSHGGLHIASNDDDDDVVLCRGLHDQRNQRTRRFRTVPR